MTLCHISARAEGMGIHCNLFELFLFFAVLGGFFNYYFYFYYFFTHLRVFQRWLIVYHWSLSDSKFPQVSRTLLSIPADLNNAVVWMVSKCPLVSKSFSSFTNLLGIVPSAPTTTGITVTFMFHSLFFFSSLTRSRYLPLFAFFYFLFVVHRNGKVHHLADSLFVVDVVLISRSGRLDETRWSVYISKSQRSLSLILQDGFWAVLILLVCMIKFEFLAQFPMTTHPNQSCLVLYSFCTNLLHLFIIFTNQFARAGIFLSGV